MKWEDHIDHLKQKLKLSIVMIKRIKKFIPKNEYLKLYNALFIPHLTYCISVWGGVSYYKLAKLFSIQKRCVRLQFGTELTFDHPEYYLTCARGRTYRHGHQLLKSLYRYMISNKLHINMSKCCFIHFKPNKTKNFNEEGENFDLLMDNIKI